MSRDEAPPFDRGETWYGGGTIDSNNLGGAQHEGKEWVFEDLVYSGVGAKAARTNRKVRCRCVRNVGAAALLPKRIAKFQETALVYGARVDGYVTLDADRGYPIDEWLPAAGVPVNDLFWIVVEGPATVLTDIASAGTNLIPVGQPVIGLTAATSGATTAGRVQSQLQYAVALSNALTAAQSGNLQNMIQNAIGRALSAKTTTNTAADLLIEVGHW